jgi:membrane-bound ClpP family serine protease
MARLLLYIGIFLIILWLLGFVVFHFTTPVIHALIAIGVILILIDLFGGRRIRR